MNPLLSVLIKFMGFDTSALLKFFEYLIELILMNFLYFL